MKDVVLVSGVFRISQIRGQILALVLIKKRGAKPMFSYFFLWQTNHLFAKLRYVTVLYGIWGVWVVVPNVWGFSKVLHNHDVWPNL